jgi:hypothetical protein
MIDYNARNNLAQQRQTQGMIAGLKDALVTGLKAKQATGEGEDVLRLVFKKEEDQAQTNAIEKIGKALALIYNQIKKPIVLPKTLNVTGKVEVSKQPPIAIANFKELEKELEKYFQSLEQRLVVFAQAAAMAPTPKIDFPEFNFPTPAPINVQGIIDAIQDLEKGLGSREKSSDTSLLRKLVDIQKGMAERPVMTPQPTTHININALNGFVQTSDNTVGMTAVTLPQYGQLFNRRSLMIYNNSANTIYIGGSTVTTSNGLPVPSGAYAPSIDAGYDLPIFGVASTNGNDIRCIEISSDKTQNIQE